MSVETRERAREPARYQRLCGAVRPRDEEDQIERKRHGEGFVHLPRPLPQRWDGKIHTRDLAISGVSEAASGSGFSGSRK